LSIKAAEIHHIPQLQCFGYTFQEPLSLPRSIDAERAYELGIASTVSFRVLKSGFPVMNDDKTREVHADDVCEPTPRPRKVTVLGDCCLVPPAMEKLALDSDVLIHEATLSLADKGQKVENGGHSTAGQAAIFANRVRAKVLLLNHLSMRVDCVLGGGMDCITEAESRIRGTTRVQLAFDHLEVLIPRRGFEFGEACSTKDEQTDENPTKQQHESADESQANHQAAS
jgi:ribonuclease BN (tRNA processing enzyme)